MLNAANIITGLRIVCSILMLFCPAFSGSFYALYLAAGFSDMIDGTVARKMGTESEFGSKLDTIADIIFLAVCLIKLLPVISLPKWIYIWISVIALIKVFNIICGYVMKKAFVPVHSVANKLTGFLLFLFPPSLAWLDLKISAGILLVLASFAAIQEGHFIRSGKV